MGKRVRVATFNVENLFNRYAILDKPYAGEDYEKLVQAVDLASIAGRDGCLVSYETTHIQRNNTAEAILAIEPDVLVVAEVENLYSLRIFNHSYLSNYFDRIILFDGNDPRGIDVGLLIRKGFEGTVANIRSHVGDVKKGAKGPVVWGSSPNFGYTASNALFSRDCLEVDVEVAGKTLTLMANHFKAQDGKESSNERRKEQADRVLELVRQRQATSFPVVLGDLNADVDGTRHNEPTAEARTLQGLVGASELSDAFGSQQDRWTHFYDEDSSVSRLDYILVDSRLSFGNQQIMRQGLSKKCRQYTGSRFATVSYQNTEASDHCPVCVDVEL